MRDQHGAVLSPGDVLTSNRGRGPLKAIIEAIYADGTVLLKRWDMRKTRGRRTQFSLHAQALARPSIGWVKLRP